MLFIPQDNIQRTLITMINNAQRNILVQAYLFTDDTIANALIRAHKRGVNVEILLDSQVMSDAKGSDGIRLYEAGIPVRLETRYENAHNKIMIFDHDTAATIKRYVDNWRKHAEESVAYAGNPVS